MADHRYSQVVICNTFVKLNVANSQLSPNQKRVNEKQKVIL